MLEWKSDAESLLDGKLSGGVEEEWWWRTTKRKGRPTINGGRRRRAAREWVTEPSSDKKPQFNPVRIQDKNRWWWEITRGKKVDGGDIRLMRSMRSLRLSGAWSSFGWASPVVASPVTDPILYDHYHLLSTPSPLGSRPLLVLLLFSSSTSVASTLVSKLQ